MLANFRGPLQNGILALLEPAVGVGSDATYFVNKFDTKLPSGEIPTSDFPVVVVYVRSARDNKPGEMGTLREINEWTTHIYYLDIDTDFDQGEKKRDEIVHRIQLAIEMQPRLGEIRVELGENLVSEYVYDSNFTNILFDQSGQEGYFTFTAEMYLSVDTAKN